MLPDIDFLKQILGANPQINEVIETIYAVTMDEMEAYLTLERAERSKNADIINDARMRLEVFMPVVEEMEQLIEKEFDRSKMTFDLGRCRFFWAALRYMNSLNTRDSHRIRIFMVYGFMPTCLGDIVSVAFQELMPEEKGDCGAHVRKYGLLMYDEIEDLRARYLD